MSDLEPPEPLERVLDRVPELAPGDFLRVLHRREPHLLYPHLDQQGYAWHTRPGGPRGFEIFVWRAGDADAAAAVEAEVG